MTFHFNANRSTACAFATAMAVAVTGCTGDQVKPSYSRSSLEPITAIQVSEYTLQIQFEEPAESMFYAGGISYIVRGDTMRIVVDRCRINATCDTMLRRHIEPGPPRLALQNIPLLAPRVVMIFADGEEQIFP